MVSVKLFFKGITFIVLIYSTYLLILLSLPYLSFQPGIEFLETKQFIYHIDWWRYSFYFHVFSSPFIILSGTILVFFNIEKRNLGLHRLLGKIYVSILLFISGPSALIMGFYANGSYPAQFSFVLLSFLWILFTYLAYKNARSKKINKHKYWMYRSFALTLSAVTLRFYAYLIDVLEINYPPIESYVILSYISWIPNLIIVYSMERLNIINYEDKIILSD